eukprot:gnl/Dysnectes_brevis/6151_a9312_388.p1 GENE.gnl/Dysnectes_brevis/6151_a9312_388~~gnl/Dysnectes_brevis/6151_a9312_388.p1  ORF type:complete len:475 (+),score=31.74 gnl/Dysnectes_brevis/6151_a9312_388:74-1498(+)
MKSSLLEGQKQTRLIMLTCCLIIRLCSGYTMEVMAASAVSFNRFFDLRVSAYITVYMTATVPCLFTPFVLDTLGKKMGLGLLLLLGTIFSLLGQGVQTMALIVKERHSDTVIYPIVVLVIGRIIFGVGRSITDVVADAVMVRHSHTNRSSHQFSLMVLSQVSSTLGCGLCFLTVPILDDLVANTVQDGMVAGTALCALSVMVSAGALSLERAHTGQGGITLGTIDPRFHRFVTRQERKHTTWSDGALPFFRFRDMAALPRLVWLAVLALGVLHGVWFLTICVGASFVLMSYYRMTDNPADQELSSKIEALSAMPLALSAALLPVLFASRWTGRKGLWLAVGLGMTSMGLMRYQEYMITQRDTVAPLVLLGLGQAVALGALWPAVRLLTPRHMMETSMALVLMAQYVGELLFGLAYIGLNNLNPEFFSVLPIIAQLLVIGTSVLSALLWGLARRAGRIHILKLSARKLRRKVRRR